MDETPKIFLSTYRGRVDESARVSIPAPFRSIIEAKGANVIYVYNSFINECLEVCTVDRIAQIDSCIEEMDFFSKERDSLSTAILATIQPLQIDSKGRVSVPERLLQSVGIEEEMLFVGKGRTFEIWESNKFDNHYANAREIAQKHRFVFNKNHKVTNE